MKKQHFFVLVALITGMCFLAGCAGETKYTRQEENFNWPNGKGVSQIGARGSSNNYGSTETGFIRECPFDEGTIITLKNVTVVEEDMPIYKDQLACKNFERMVKKTKKTTYTHQYVVKGKTVFEWDSDHENWWAMLPAYILSRLIERGVDVAAFAATNGLSETGDVVISAEGGEGGKATVKSNVENQPEFNQQQEQQLQPPTKDGKKHKGKKGHKGKK